MPAKLFTAAALSAAVTLAALSGAQAANVQFQHSSTSPLVATPVTNTFGYIQPLTCVVSGTPVEFPSDMLVRNRNASTIPAGTVIHWQIQNGPSGTYVLPAALGGHQSTHLWNAIPGGWPAGASCTATI